MMIYHDTMHPDSYIHTILGMPVITNKKDINPCTHQKGKNIALCLYATEIHQNFVFSAPNIKCIQMNKTLNSFIVIL